MSTTHKDVIERINAAFARNDVEGFLVYCTEDFVWRMAGEPPIRGKDAVREFMKSAPSEPPTFSVDALVADGDVVVAQGGMTMVEEGRRVAYEYCDVWRFRGRQAAELKVFAVKAAGAEEPEPLTRAAGR
jgi:ketosteroid isomerase-like protein